MSTADADTLAELASGAATAIAHEMADTDMGGINEDELADRLGMVILDTLQMYLVGYRRGLSYRPDTPEFWQK